MSVGHVLDHVPDHVSDHMIIDLVATTLQKLKNYNLFPNLKKYWFYKDEVRFLGYVISAQKI